MASSSLLKLDLIFQGHSLLLATDFLSCALLIAKGAVSAESGSPDVSLLPLRFMSGFAFTPGMKQKHVKGFILRSPRSRKPLMEQEEMCLQTPS